MKRYFGSLLFHTQPAVRPVSLRKTRLTRCGQRSVSVAAPKPVRIPSTSDGGNPKIQARLRGLALTVAYDGTRYSGLVLNDYVDTVNEQLLGACRKAGLLPRSEDAAAASHQAYRARQTSRTDRLVHAMRNVVVIHANSLYLEDKGTELRLDALAARIRTHLPSDIELLSATRVGQGLCPQKEATERSYDYFLPLAMLAGDTHGAAVRQAVEVGRQSAATGGLPVLPVDSESESSTSFYSSEGQHRAIMPALGSTRMRFQATDRETDNVSALRRVLAEAVGVHAVHNFTTGKVREAGVKKRKNAKHQDVQGIPGTSTQTQTQTQTEDGGTNGPEYRVVRDQGHVPLAAVRDRDGGALGMGVSEFSQGRQNWDVSPSVTRRIVEACVSEPFVLQVQSQSQGQGTGAPEPDAGSRTSSGSVVPPTAPSWTAHGSEEHSETVAGPPSTSLPPPSSTSFSSPDGLFGPASVSIAQPGTLSLPMIRVSLTGTGFLLHQIRHTIGLAIAEVRGDVPRGSFRAALSMPRYIPLPLGAPTTLLLRSPHFGSGSRLAVDQSALPLAVPSDAPENYRGLAASAAGGLPSVLALDVRTGASMASPRAPDPPGEGADVWGADGAGGDDGEIPFRQLQRSARHGHEPLAPARGDLSGELPWGQRRLLQEGDARAFQPYEQLVLVDAEAEARERQFFDANIVPRLVAATNSLLLWPRMQRFYRALALRRRAVARAFELRERLPLLPYDLVHGDTTRNFSDDVLGEGTCSAIASLDVATGVKGGSRSASSSAGILSGGEGTSPVEAAAGLFSRGRRRSDPTVPLGSDSAVQGGGPPAANSTSFPVPWLWMPQPDAPDASVPGIEVPLSFDEAEVTRDSGASSIFACWKSKSHENWAGVAGMMAAQPVGRREMDALRRRENAWWSGERLLLQGSERRQLGRRVAHARAALGDAFVDGAMQKAATDVATIHHGEWPGAWVLNEMLPEPSRRHPEWQQLARMSWSMPPTVQRCFGLLMEEGPEEWDWTVSDRITTESIPSAGSWSEARLLPAAEAATRLPPEWIASIASAPLFAEDDEETEEPMSGALGSDHGQPSLQSMTMLIRALPTRLPLALRVCFPSHRHLARDMTQGLALRVLQGALPLLASTETAVARVAQEGPQAIATAGKWVSFVLAAEKEKHRKTKSRQKSDAMLQAAVDAAQGRRTTRRGGKR